MSTYKLDIRNFFEFHERTDSSSSELPSQFQAGWPTRAGDELDGYCQKSRLHTVIEFLGTSDNFYRANREQARKNQDWVRSSRRGMRNVRKHRPWQFLPQRQKVSR